MTVVPQPGNARHLTVPEVAASFVPPAAFWQLVEPGNHLLIGSRGSGKTTLLKMLTPLAAGSWDHPEAARLQEQLSFSGIFIPSDRAWYEQLALAASLGLEEATSRAVCRATFGLQMLRSFLVALELRSGARKGAVERSVAPALRFSEDQEAEAEFVTELSGAWSAAPRVPSLQGLRRTLASQSRDVGQLLLKGKSDDALDEWVKGHLYLQTPFVALDHASEMLEDHFSIPFQRWSVMCDELELAPSFLLDELFRAIRNTPERISLKLALAPITPELRRAVEENDGDLARRPSTGDDYSVVKLGGFDPLDEGQLRFCRALASRYLKGAGFGDGESHAVLGRSFNDADSADWLASGTAYGDTAARVDRIRQVAAADQSLAQHLGARGIDIGDVDDLAPDARAATLRKYYPLVVLRDEFIDFGSGRARSRKAMTLYTGEKAIFAISESNPRVLLNLLGDMHRRSPRGRRGITRSAQASAVRAEIRRLEATLGSLPIPSEVTVNVVTPSGRIARRSIRTQLELVQAIGQYFREEVLGAKFNPDPVASFHVDGPASQLFESALTVLASLGAIIEVHESSHDRDIETSVLGRRFRLCNRLAANFRLPLRNQRAIGLSRILQGHESGESAGGSSLAGARWGVLGSDEVSWSALQVSLFSEQAERSSGS